MINKIFSELGKQINTDAIVSNIRSAAKVVSGEFGLFMGAGINVIKGLQGVGAVAQEDPLTKSIISFAGVINGIFQLVSPAFKMEELVAIKNDMDHNIETLPATDSQERRVQVLTKSCNFVIANEKKIRKQLGLDKAIKLDEMARRLQAGLNSEDAEVRTRTLAEGETLMNQLKGRVNLRVGIETTKLALRTTGVAISIMSLFTGTTVASMIALGAIGVATLALWTFERVMLPKDPFTPPANVWHEQMALNIRNTINNIL